VLPNDPRRFAIRELATTQIGLVYSYERESEPDETGRYRRRGWDRLLEYFRVAAPGSLSDDNITYVGRPLPSWCGIFALWAIKSSGLPVGTWHFGQGIGSVRGFKATPDPLPGDVGCFIAHGHMDIIYDVDGDDIETVDGNAGAIGGEITGRNRRKRRDFDAGFLTVFQPNLFPSTPVGLWKVQIGADKWIYHFHRDGVVFWYDLYNPPQQKGHGTWKMSDAVYITWTASVEQWNLPLNAENQTGMWTPQDDIANLVWATKIG
jgi:hypothetical protein